MRKGIVMAALLFIAGCGYESTENSLICQPKKLRNNTPILCGNYTDVDVSLGVMQNGVGSVSTADEWLEVPDKRDRDILQKAIDSGKIVKLTYDVRRLTFCVPDHVVTKVEVL